MLYKHGGVWLDLRGTPASDPQGMGLEAMVHHFKKGIPPLLFCGGGQHREKFGGEYGEIINGFMLSAPGLEVWQLVWSLAADMIESYPERWSN